MAVLSGAALGLPAHGASEVPAEILPVTEKRTWQSWTRQHGLPDNRVQGVLQTRDGYLWVSTPGGLARFDGRHWEVLSRGNAPELPAQGCQAMLEDAEGNLWLRFREGLFRWDGRAFVRAVSESASAPLGCSCAGGSGGIWIIAGSDLWRWRGSEKRAFPLPAPLRADNTHALREVGGKLWIGHAHGVIRFDLSTEQFEGGTPQDDRAWGYVHGLEADSQGKLWVLSGAGVPFRARLSPLDSGRWLTNQAMPVYNGSRITFLFRDRQGNLWFPNSRGCIASWQQGRRTNFALPPPAATDFALAFADDADGGLWIGMEDSGLIRCRPGRVGVLSHEQGLTQDNAWTACETRDGSVWIGTDGGVSRFRNGNPTHYTQSDGLSRNAVRSLVEDEDGRLWIGTTSGLDWIENGRVRHHRFPGAWFNTKIRALLAGRHRALWVGTAQGLHCLRLREHSATGEPAGPPAEARLPPFDRVVSYGPTNGLPSDDIRALLEDRAGNLWVGTWLGGLHRFTDGAFQAGPGELSGHSVWALHEDVSGALWLGTDHGLARLKQGHCKVFTSRDGLPDDTINHLLSDRSGFLWLGGERGIYRFNLRELEEVAAGRATPAFGVIYSDDEGLPSSETNGQKNQPGAIRTRDGRLWFPTTKGMVIFDPARLPDSTNPPPVILEQMRAGGEVIFDHRPGQARPAGAPALTALAAPGPANLPLPAGRGRNLEFHYTACAFVAADRMRFRYRLEGLEDAWTEAGARRTAQYANLKPGRYRFQVLAGNKYGVWNETGASLAFTLAPFPWQTWWFKSLCLAGAALAGAGLYRWRLLQHRRLADAERRAAVAHERAEIARDLHDHLGARITLMQHLSESLDRPLPSSREGEAARQRLARLAGELNASLDSAVWAVQPDKDTLVSLADYLGDSFHELLTGTPIELELEFPEPIPDWPLSRVERYHLASVAIEALNNILKHAGARLVRLRLQVEDASFKLFITDDGCGFAPAKWPAPTPDLKPAGRGRGLANMRQRVTLLGGQFELSSRPGQGTTIAITLAPSALRRPGKKAPRQE